VKDIVHRGLTWRDFPGNCDAVEKRLNFSIFRLGKHLYNAACEGPSEIHAPATEPDRQMCAANDHTLTLQF
jgi:hypothetical protein